MEWPMGGVVDTWHSYVPESRRWGYFTCSVQSSVWGKCDATNLWSDVYVSTPTVRRWISLCLTHDTYKKKETHVAHPLHVRRDPRNSRGSVQRAQLSPHARINVHRIRSRDCSRCNLSGFRYCGRVKMILTPIWQ